MSAKIKYTDEPVGPVKVKPSHLSPTQELRQVEFAADLQRQGSVRSKVLFPVNGKSEFRLRTHGITRSHSVKSRRMS